KLKEVKVRGGQAPAALTTDGAAPTLTAGDFESPAYKTKYQVGYAQHLRDALPHATFVAFTGTPVSAADRDTRAVFGDYIHVYDMQQA
ncbi:hypothetical protein ACXWOJ_09220, partial [Streptococcus pyogenes]